MKVTINCREFCLERFYFKPTYDGCLGSASSSLNRSLVENMRKPDSWGYAPFCKINITEDFINNMLPPFECYAWLVSEETVKDDDAMFSHLIVGWFGTITPLMPIETVLSTNLSLLDWAGNAEDFNL